MNICEGKLIQKIKTMNNKYMLFGAGCVGAKVVNLFGADSIICFIDNNKFGSKFCGIPILSLEDARKICHNTTIIITIREPEFLKEVYEQLSQYEMNYISIDNLFLEYLKEFKNEDGIYYRKYKDEINYMLSRNRVDLLPYPFKDKYLSMDIHLVYHEKEMLYKFINGDKPIYFPEKLQKNWGRYIRNLLAEQDADSPHRYFTSRHTIRTGDIFVDVGGAEALTSLEVVNAVEKVYIFEGNTKWYNALYKTFRRYEDKVVIVPKFVGKECNANTITLDSYFENIPGSLFIKVDIEGSERLFLDGAKNTLQRRGTRLSLCTYHKSEDAGEFYSVLVEMGYKCEFSKGWMFVNGDFAKGVLYANNSI